MKIDRSKAKKSDFKVTLECQTLIDNIRSCTTQDELCAELLQVRTWTYGETDVLHWADVFDMLDDVLERYSENAYRWSLGYPENEKHRNLLVGVLQFSALLVEHSSSRHLYNSIEHLTTLLSFDDMNVVLSVLNFISVLSQRSSFLSHQEADKRQALIQQLLYLAETWIGSEKGFGLATCCQNLAQDSYPSSPTTVILDFYEDVAESPATETSPSRMQKQFYLQQVHQLPQKPCELMEKILAEESIPFDKQMELAIQIRAATSFSNYARRLDLVQARLQAISVLVYSNVGHKVLDPLLYTGFVEEIVEVLRLVDPCLTDIQASALRTLSAIVHLGDKKINNVVDATGARSCDGFLPVMMRNCIEHMIDSELTPFPQVLTTALFSLFYHLASHQTGGEALVSCGIMESLLRVVNWFGDDGQDHITFATKAVRVVDLITNLDMQAFQSLGGMVTFIDRLQHEVDICRKEQPYVIRVKQDDSSMSESSHMSPDDRYPNEMDTSFSSTTDVLPSTLTDVLPSTLTDVLPSTLTDVLPSTLMDVLPSMSAEDAQVPGKSLDGHPTSRGFTGICSPQRGALLKSMLSFLKKAITDTSFSDSIRHLMDGSLPRSLKHIISNTEYYDPSCFLLATELVTVYVFQEPSMLSPLQANGLMDVVLQALLVKDVPATKEVLSSLPNVFSALCLNNKGLEAFAAYRPFHRLIETLCPNGNADAAGVDIASRLGNIFDDLIGHQKSSLPPQDTIKNVTKLVEDFSELIRSMPLKPVPTNKRTAESEAENQDETVKQGADLDASAVQQEEKAAGSGVEKQKSKRRKKSKTCEDVVEPEIPDPSLDLLNSKRLLVFVDSDNWTKGMKSLFENVRSDVLLWIFRGEKNRWTVPIKNKAFNDARKHGNVHVQGRSGPTKDSADFDIVLKIGRYGYDDKVSKSIPFVILSGDTSFAEVERNFNKEQQRRVKHISPHQLEEKKLTVLFDSVIKC